MRVALYHPWVYLKGGIERTLLELVTRSRHDWTIFTGHYAREDTFPEFQHLPVVELGQLSVRRSVPAVAAACLRLMATRPAWDGYDALMISCESIGNLLTLRAGGLPLFCLCHTPLKLAYDRWTRERWERIRRPSLATRAAVDLFAMVDRRMWPRYRRVFCVSNEVRRRVLGAGLVAPERAEVTHPGVDVERLAPSGRREPMLLIPGRIMWAKNIELGIRAFIAWKRAGGDAARCYRLVIAGMVDEKSRPYLAGLRREAAGRDDIEFVTNPSDDALFDLYDRCHTVLFTALNEDWGIVPVEAMAFGKPVIAVARGGPAESIVNGESGLLRPPRPEAFVAALSELTADGTRYTRMSVAARARAACFDWEQFVSFIDDRIEHDVAQVHPFHPRSVERVGERVAG